MSDSKAMLRRFFDRCVNQNDLSVLPELVGADYVNHDLPLPPGTEGMRAMIGMFRAAFPDLNVTLEDVFADGDIVGSRGYFTGTHRGEFQGVPATGKTVRVPFMDLWRVANGKLTENWVRMDLLGLMQQLGAIPAAR